MFRHFSSFSRERFERSVVVEDSYFCYFPRRFVKYFSFRRKIRCLRGHLLRARKRANKSRLKREPWSRKRSGRRSAFARLELGRIWGRRNKHLAISIHQPIHINLRKTFMNIVQCIQGWFIPATENTRKSSRRNTYLVCKILLRHSHVFHESTNSILHNVCTYKNLCLFVFLNCHKGTK